MRWRRWNLSTREERKAEEEEVGILLEEQNQIMRLDCLF